MSFRTLCLVSCVACAASLSAAVPTVSHVALRGGRRATITYDLSDVPGIVTLEIQTNAVADLSGAWHPLDPSALETAGGEAFCLVRPGTGHRIIWTPPQTLGRTLRNARAVVTAWATNSPPDYCVGDLEGKDVPRYYPSADHLPAGGLTNDLYRTKKIVFKRVRAKGRTYTMGEYYFDDSRFPRGGNPHQVTLARDYYLGVFEVTQAQYHYATGKERPYEDRQWEAGMQYASTLPFCVGWMYNIRCSKAYDCGLWPQDGYEAADGTFIGEARKKSQLFIDLPTEAEWEFAARCGGQRTTTQIVNGTNATYAAVAWVGATSDDQMHRVGDLLPNDYGFYDMLGNASEWCLDRVSRKTDSTTPVDLDADPVTDPIGEQSGTIYNIQRGATYAATAAKGVFNCSVRSTYGEGQHGYGFRVAVIIEPHVFSETPAN